MWWMIMISTIMIQLQTQLFFIFGKYCLIYLIIMQRCCPVEQCVLLKVLSAQPSGSVVLCPDTPRQTNPACGSSTRCLNPLVLIQQRWLIRVTVPQSSQSTWLLFVQPYKLLPKHLKALCSLYIISVKFLAALKLIVSGLGMFCWSCWRHAVASVCSWFLVKLYQWDSDDFQRVLTGDPTH